MIKVKGVYSLVVVALLLPPLAVAGVTYTPVTAAGKAGVKLSGIAVKCKPLVGEKPAVKSENKDVTLLCKPQYLHMRGIAATKVNLQLLYSGKGYASNIHVYRLKYHTIHGGGLMKANQKVG
jgi:hypothetical protein